MPVFEEFRKSTTGALDRAKLFVTGQEAEEEDVEAQQPDRLEELSQYCPQLTFQQRLIGFAVSFALGYMIAFFSFRFFIQMVEYGRPLPFALNYTFGHVLQLLASTFLCGPKRQFKNMFDEKRRITSTVYLSCLAGALVVIFLPLPGSLKLIVLMLVMLTQLLASVWYSLSYVPYGRRTALRCIKRQLGISEGNYAGITAPGGISLGGGSGG